ncbi:MAG: hypothetical protein H6510_11160 [Acidobacteria bacterium]|nr:hypothetical protein [Acidobacteriota bacterium]MCB9398363.1 hypothetical protein [Acidobacteriota bacterium]
MNLIFSFLMLAGTASGSATLDGFQLAYSHAAAVQQPNEFFPERTEWLIVLSDLPVQAIDIRDETVPFEAGYLEIRFDEKRAVCGVVFHKGFSETGGGGDLKFSGTLQETAKGKLTTGQPLDIMGSSLSIDVSFEADIVTSAHFEKQMTAKGSKAETSAQGKCFKSVLDAIKNENIELARKAMSQSWEETLAGEWGGGISTLAYSLDLPEQFQYDAVWEGAGQSRLYLKTEDRIGTLIFLKEQDELKLESVNWRYTF